MLIYQKYQYQDKCILIFNYVEEIVIGSWKLKGDHFTDPVLLEESCLKSPVRMVQTSHFIS